MTAPVTSPSAQAYLAAVKAELADLPADERTELLEDLELHLDSVEAEGGDLPLTARLGPAADYAAELRAAAGLPTREPAPRRRGPRVRRIAALLVGSAALRETRAFLPTLAPAWWVLRGYLIVLLPCLRQPAGARDFPVPAPGGSHALGVAAVVAAVVVSVALGRRRLPRPVTFLVWVIDAVLAVAAFGTLQEAPRRLATHSVQVVRPAQDPAFQFSPLITEHGPVTDIYPYATDGTPLHDVLLYDQDGRPMQTGKQLWWPDGCRRVLVPPLALDGGPVPFAYPQHYVLDRATVDLSGNPVDNRQCKPVTRVSITPPALVKKP